MAGVGNVTTIALAAEGFKDVVNGVAGADALNAVNAIGQLLNGINTIGQGIRVMSCLFPTLGTSPA